MSYVPREARGHHVVWFVEPIGTFSNNSIINFLGNVAENICEALHCKGRTVPVQALQCEDYDQIAKIEESAKKLPDLKFQVWRRKGAGLAELWPRPGKGFRRKSHRLKMGDKQVKLSYS